jgi:peptidyl-prolyl cis-trans isomerase C
MAFHKHLAWLSVPRVQPLYCAALAALVAAPFWLPIALQAQDAPDTVVARVNGTEIRTSDLAMAEEEIGSNLPPMPPEAKREYLTTYVTDLVLAAQAAEARKLADTPEGKRRLAYARNKTLMEMLLQTEAKAALTEEAMRKVYEEATKQIGSEQETRARHILVETEAEAKTIAEELKKGADFAELAKQKSKDPGAADGGDLGYFTKDQMVPEFAEAAFKMEVGKISDPIKSQFGWHVIKVEDRRVRPVPEYEKVKDQIEQFLVRRTQTELITKLRQDAKIEKVATQTAPTPAPNPPVVEPKK